MSGGWIKAHRAMLDHPMLQSATRKGVWLDLLLRAAHQPTAVSLRGRIVHLRPGECAVVVSDWASDLGLTRRQIDRIVDSFVSEGGVLKRTEGGKALTVLTICKYGEYQSLGKGRGESAGKAGGNRGGIGGETEQEPKESQDSESDMDSLFDSRKPELDTNNRAADLFSDAGGLPKAPHLTLVQAGQRKLTDKQLGECFDTHFWPLYPNRKGKLAAKAKFITQARQHTAKAIVAGLRRSVQAWEAAGTETKFIPLPATWLNQGRWLDEHQNAKPRPVNNARQQSGYGAY